MKGPGRHPTLKGLVDDTWHLISSAYDDCGRMAAYDDCGRMAAYDDCGRMAAYDDCGREDRDCGRGNEGWRFRVHIAPAACMED